jgi:hypothetical protein
MLTQARILARFLTITIDHGHAYRRDHPDEVPDA